MFGCAFYIGLGSNRIAHTWMNVAKTNKDMKLSIGALAIINGFVYLVDVLFAVIDLKND